MARQQGIQMVQLEAAHSGPAQHRPARRLRRDGLMVAAALAAAGLAPLAAPRQAEAQQAPQKRGAAASSPRVPPDNTAWRINANGFQGELRFSIDSSGNVSGSMEADGGRIDPIQGFWNEVAQRITFQRIIFPGDPSSIQTYTGYYFLGSPGTDRTHFLAGFFEAFASGGGLADRNIFGWWADLRVIG